LEHRLILPWLWDNSSGDRPSRQLCDLRNIVLAIAELILYTKVRKESDFRKRNDAFVEGGKDAGAVFKLATELSQEAKQQYRA
jgi:hypothetical protein